MLGDTNNLPDYYAKIYQKHNVTEAKFKESFAWYSKNPEKLKLVYEAAIVELSKIEVEINTRKKVKAETIKDDANFTDTTIVWNLSYITIAIMTIPNLFGILVLRRDIRTTIRTYWTDFKKDWPQEKLPLGS